MKQEIQIIVFALFIFFSLESKKALIFGVTGQDGSYLAELLLQKGYEVHGVKRRASSFNTQRIDHLYIDPHNLLGKRLILHYGDLTDSLNIVQLINKICPDEIYNLGAQSHVQVSFEMPEYTTQSNALGALRILEAIRQLNLCERTRYYQASTSELFGKVQGDLQTEMTPFYPRSPYGAAKIYSYWITKIYRESYGIFACNGILFNHESERRGGTFVTRKVINAVVRILKGSQKVLFLGNLDAKRDWGYAPDYAEAMWLMLQQKEPHDLVIATGEVHSVREFVEKAFEAVGVNLTWEGKGINEVGKEIDSGRILVKVDKKYFRPNEVEYLRGDFSKAKQILGWSPKVSFPGLIKKMMHHELLTFKG